MVQKKVIEIQDQKSNFNILPGKNKPKKQSYGDDIDQEVDSFIFRDDDPNEHPVDSNIKTKVNSKVPKNELRSSPREIISMNINQEGNVNHAVQLNIDPLNSTTTLNQKISRYQIQQPQQQVKSSEL